MAIVTLALLEIMFWVIYLADVLLYNSYAVWRISSI